MGSSIPFLYNSANPSAGAGSLKKDLYRPLINVLIEWKVVSSIDQKSPHQPPLGLALLKLLALGHASLQHGTSSWDLGLC